MRHKYNRCKITKGFVGAIIQMKPAYEQGRDRWPSQVEGFCRAGGANLPFRSTNIVVNCAQKALGAGIGSKKLEKREKSDRYVSKRMRKQKPFLARLPDSTALQADLGFV
jgi:hypothetical protein